MKAPSSHQRPEAPALDREEPLSLERELVRRAGAGDPRAQTSLLKRLLPRFRAITRALLLDNADAEDALQLSLLAVLRSAPGFRGEAGLESWAKRIAIRTTLRHMARERKVRNRVAEEADPELVLVSDMPEWAWETLPKHVSEYLGDLSEAQRVAVVLHHALGFSAEEIAELTEVSSSTVKGRLRLGTDALRKRVRRDLLIGARKRTTA